jgi:hypothetical protein
MSPEQFGMLMADKARRMQGESLEGPLRQCLPVLLQGYENNILRAEGPDGAPWPPHAPSTVKRMGPHPLLIWHGHLIEAARDTGHPGNVHEVEDQGRTLVTGVLNSVIEYAAVHQWGSEKKNIPPRTYVYATPAVLEQCEGILGDGIYAQIWGDQ